MTSESQQCFFPNKVAWPVIRLFRIILEGLVVFLKLSFIDASERQRASVALLVCIPLVKLQNCEEARSAFRGSLLIPSTVSSVSIFTRAAR